MKPKFTLNLPNSVLVREACLLFNEQNRLLESALRELFERYPKNTQPSHVLLKVAAVNALYHTNIYAVETVALHIAEHGAAIDAAFAAGEPEIVDLISRVEVKKGKTRQFFSFASKYASWHRPGEYPIYDSRVYGYLSHVKRETNLFGFLTGTDWNYARFKGEMSQFREHFQLNDCTYKELDAFLYMEGAKLFETPADGERQDLNPSADLSIPSKSPAAD
jgi:hypothetical protein